jgi:hypothetical protein
VCIKTIPEKASTTYLMNIVDMKATFEGVTKPIRSVRL